MQKAVLQKGFFKKKISTNNSKKNEAQDTFKATLESGTAGGYFRLPLFLTWHFQSEDFFLKSFLSARKCWKIGRQEKNIVIIYNLESQLIVSRQHLILVNVSGPLDWLNANIYSWNFYLKLPSYKEKYSNAISATFSTGTSSKVSWVHWVTWFIWTDVPGFKVKMTCVLNQSMVTSPLLFLLSSYINSERKMVSVTYTKTPVDKFGRT